MPLKNPHPLYSVWQGMKRRCYNPNFRQFADYGGRGIAVCDRWRLSFESFVGDMGPRPVGYSLERIDNEKGYSPENCKWASKKAQQRNQRCTRTVTIEGVEYRAVDLADQCRWKTDTIIARAALGMTLADVLSNKRRVNSATVAKGVASSRTKKLAKTHCPKGHPWDADNTRITPEGWRNCRACHRDKMRRRTAAKRLVSI